MSFSIYGETNKIKQTLKYSLCHCHPIKFNAFGIVETRTGSVTYVVQYTKSRHFPDSVMATLLFLMNASKFLICLHCLYEVCNIHSTSGC